MNQDGIDLLKEYESCRLKAFIPVTGDPPTIGFGRTSGVKMGDTCTQAQAEEWLKQDIQVFERGVLALCTLHPNDNELAAMTCLAYNVGLGNFKKSTVLKAHNRGDIQSASRAFGLFNKAHGKVLAGLTRRRASEAALYLKPTPESQADHPMPQVVDAESPVATKPLNLLGGITASGGLLGGLSGISEKTTDTTDKVNGIVESAKTAHGWFTDAADWLGFSPLVLAGGLLFVIGVAIIVQRLRIRYNGWS